MPLKKKTMSKEQLKTVNIPVNNGGVPADQIQRWKAQYRKVSEIVIDDEGEKHAGYFRRPDMETLSAVSKLGKTDDVKAANALFENCWLGGSPLIREDAVIKMSAIGQLNKLMEVAQATLKNL